MSKLTEQRKLIGYYRLLKAVKPEWFQKPINPQLKVLKQEERKCPKTK